MKIVTWNCNGALRKKFHVLEIFDADIYVIQECEDPSKTKDKKFIEWADRYLWKGDSKNKGIGVFVKKNLRLERLDWSDRYEDKSVKYFLPCRINNDFNLLAIWTHRNNSPTTGYIGQLWKYLKINQHLFNKSLLVGDFNSNKLWNKKRRIGNHTDVVNELLKIEIRSFYHEFYNEKQGEETRPTFFLHRKKEKSYHIDYIFGSQEFEKALQNFEIGEVDYWLEWSDHLPLICNF